MKRLTLGGVLLLLVATGARAQVLDISGTSLAALVGHRADRITVARWQGGVFRAVPSQWLAWSKGRPPWFSADDDAKRSRPANIIAPQDHLLLRHQDAGPQAPSPLPDKVLATLRLGSAEDPEGWFYLFERAPPDFPPAVTLERHPLAIHSADYRLEFRNGNLFQWGDFTWHAYQPPPGHGPSLLDTLKLRLSAGIFTDSARMTLTNENLDPSIRQVIQGPLATLVYVTTHVEVAYIPVLTIHNYLILERDRMIVDSRFTIPGIAELVLRDPAARITVDGNALEGSHLRTSWTGDREAVVDGHISKTEKAMRRMPVDQDSWLWFDTRRGFALLARLDFVHGLNTRLHFVYQDNPNLNDPPERFPGQRPNVGFRLDGIPFGHRFYFHTAMVFSSQGHGLAPQAWAHQAFGAPDATLITRSSHQRPGPQG